MSVADASPILNPHAGVAEVNNEKLKQLHKHATGVAQTPGMAKGVCPFLALQLGATQFDDDHSLKAGVRGPTLMEDQVLREKINHFDHERIPERVVHARGAGAHGHFELYSSQAHLTKAAIFNDTDVKTPVFIRFSTVLGSRGSLDTARDVRGFAMKFYTTEGNWDLVANNIPVFFIQDAMKFPDVIHAGKPDQQTEMPQAQTAHDNFWDFISWTPEAMHMILWAMSDRAIPRSFRMMQGFGVHTFSLVNKDEKRTFVKFHVRPKLGVHGLAWDECMKLGGADPDFHRRDLYEAIASGNSVQYELGFQCIEEADEHKFDFDLLDPTKIVPEELVPIQWIGKIVLDRLPTDFFAEVEQVAFCTQNVVPGIDFTNDPLLQGRNFSYLDTQLTRLGGPNFNQIPINQPLVQPINNQRDGFMQMNIHTDHLNYFPNRMSAVGKAARPVNGGESQSKLSPHEVRQNAIISYRERMDGMKERIKAPKFLEFFEQASLFYNSLTPVEQLHLLEAASFELSRCVDLGVRERMRDLFNEVDHELAKKLAKNIGVKQPGKPNHVNSGNKSAFLSMISSPYTPMDSIATRKVAVILGDGYRAAELSAVQAALKKEGAMLKVVGMHAGTIFAEDTKGAAAKGDAAFDASSDNGEGVMADFTIKTAKSVLFDATVLIGGPHIAELQKCGLVSSFICETMKHCKAIAACSEAVPLLEYPCSLAGISISTKMTLNDQAVISAGAMESAFTGHLITAMKKHRFWERNVDPIPA